MKKNRGLPINPNDSEDFAMCINSSKFFDVGFKDNPFTWWNDRTNGECFFERLDRVLTNQLLIENYRQYRGRIFIKDRI